MFTVTKKLSLLLILAIAISSCQNNKSEKDNSTAETDVTTTKTVEKSAAEIARGFYQDVCVNKDTTKFDNYIAAKYDQYATGYEDGAEALRTELTAASKNKNMKVTILRVIGESNYAALHSLWEENGQQYLYVDIWRVENGKLMAHWDQTQQPNKNPLNTNTIYSGPDIKIDATQNIEENRKKAIAVLKTFDNVNDISAIENFISDQYIQHNATVKDGKAGLLEFIKILQKNKFKNTTTIAKTIAQGDMVMLHSKTSNPENPKDLGTGVIDIFRFDKDGKIAEHWDINEPLTGKSLNKNNSFSYPYKD
jgi:predicted SnoaL-like aldol condensation-catalyzing enzyme